MFMKKFTKNLLPLLALAAVMTIVSCGEDDETIFEDPDPTDSTASPFDARLNTSDADSLTAEIFLSDVTDGTIDLFITFISDDASMRRIYSTLDSLGQGEEAFTLGALTGAEDKADGSLELDSDQTDAFTVNLDLPTEGLPTEGTYVYKFWTTTGRGDFRDDTKRQATTPITLTVDLGGTNPDKALIEYSETITLEAPLGDATSETFVSSLTGDVYKISDGEEYAALWDFGFYYLNSTGVSLASTAEYPALFADPDGGEGLVTVNAFLGIESTEVNDAYFRLAPEDTDFSTFEFSDDLTFEMTESDEQDINQLAVGDVVYYMDQYGSKGVLEITDLVGSFGSDGYVSFNLKVERGSAD